MMKDKKEILTAIPLPLPDLSKDKDGKDIGRKIDPEMYKDLEEVDQETVTELSSEPPFSRTCGVDLASGKDFTAYQIMRNGQMETLNLKDASTQDKLYWINRFRMARHQLEAKGHPGADAYTKPRQAEIDALRSVETDLIASIDTPIGKAMKAVTIKEIDNSLDKAKFAEATENLERSRESDYEEIDDAFNSMNGSSYRRSEAQTTNYRKVYGRRRPIFDFFANIGEWFLRWIG